MGVNAKQTRRIPRAWGREKALLGRGTRDASLSEGALPDPEMMNHLGASFKQGRCLSHLYNSHVWFTPVVQWMARKSVDPQGRGLV